MAKKNDLWLAATAASAELKELGLELPEKEADITVPELEKALKLLEKDTQEKDGEKEKAASSDGKLLRNMRKNPVSVGGVKIAPEGKVELTAAQLKNERLMTKINHGVKTGVYKWVK